MKKQHNLWEVFWGYIPLNSDHKNSVCPDIGTGIFLRYLILILLTGLGLYGHGQTNYFGGSGAGNANTGFYNTFLGVNSGRLNTSGSDNTFLGRRSGYNNVTGNKNTLLGVYTGYDNTTGEGNTMIGFFSGSKSTTGNNNTFIGRNSGYNNGAGSGNIFIGYNAGFNERGSNKLFIDNTATSIPLIWGDFSRNIVNINGNLGIGTTNPTQKLEVNGNLLIDGSDNSGSVAGLMVRSGTQHMFMDGNEIDANGTLYLNFNSYEDVSMVPNGGNVGIGTSTPAGRFQIIDEERDSNGSTLVLGPTDASNLRMGYHADYSWVQSHGSKPLRINELGNDLILNLRSGNVGIGIQAPSHKLHVNGAAYATSFVSSAASFPDYVFKEGYDLMPLDEMETFVQAHHHLPNMPSETEVVSQGMNLNTIVTQSVENIEAIYLHLIRMEKELKELKEENRGLKTTVDNLLSVEPKQDQ